jgi:hypothetical protein
MPKTLGSLAEKQAYFKGIGLKAAKALTLTGEIYFLHEGDAVDLMERRHAGKDFLECRFTQARQPFGLGGATNF